MLTRALRQAARQAAARLAPPPGHAEARPVALWLPAALRCSSQAVLLNVAEEDVVGLGAIVLLASRRLRCSAGPAEAAQHRHLRAHRLRQDDADGAYSLLHRTHPRDSRGTLLPTRVRLAAAPRLSPQDVSSRACRLLASSCLSPLSPAAPRSQVRGKDGVGAKMDSMDLEREKGITIKARALRRRRSVGSRRCPAGCVFGG